MTPETYCLELAERLRHFCEKERPPEGTNVIACIYTLMASAILAGGTEPESLIEAIREIVAQNKKMKEASPKPAV